MSAVGGITAPPGARRRWRSGVTDMVLIHGTTQSAAGFTGLVEALGERGHAGC